MAQKKLLLLLCIALRLISLNCEQNSACNDCHKNSQRNAIPEEGNSKSSGEGNDNTKEKLLERYPKCFRGVGLFSGEYDIDLKKDAEPVIHPPRRVLESMLYLRTTPIETGLPPPAEMLFGRNNQSNLPSSPPRGKRKHVSAEENNGDDNMMNMHVT